MIRRTLACMLTLGLVACATQPQAPAPAPHPTGKPIGTGGTPAEAAPERKPDLRDARIEAPLLRRRVLC